MKVFILLSVFAVALARECGLNQHYESCGTTCPLTCDNYDDPPLTCVQMCNPGCHCDEGYVNDDGRCVKPEQCPQKVCGENERYAECGSACPLTCDNYLNPPKICPAMCVSGCQCEKGFVKARDGRCVKPEECPAQTSTEANCGVEPETGMCKAYIPSFYYDPKTGQCKKFIYGGCGGNSNRYLTEQACLEKCSGVRVQNTDSSTCDLPAEVGVCRGNFPRFYFDRTTGQCHEFVYGGCGGNENNFESIEECQQSCGVQASESLCSLPAVTGRCRGYFPRYYYNEKTGKCEKFIYGGCGGNGNNFEKLEDCHETCVSA